MSIMIIYGNNKTASIYTDCRITCTMQDGNVEYYEHGCKLCKFNKTLIGIIGDGKYSEKIYECLKNSKTTYFKDSKSYVNAEFETLYELCLKYSKEYNEEFKNGLGCLIAIAGINKNNQIVMDYFHTSDYKHHITIPEDSHYFTKAFTNLDEVEIDPKVHNIVNTTEERMISFELHNMIIDDVLPNDDSVNVNYSCNSITLE